MRNIRTADICVMCRNTETLSPHLRINNKLIKDSFSPQQLFLPFVDLAYKIHLNGSHPDEAPIVISYWKNEEGRISVGLEVHFRQNRPGIMHAVFSALSRKETDGSLVTDRVNVNWFELLTSAEGWVLKLNCEIENFSLLERVVKKLNINMKEMEQKETFENGERESYVVEFELERPETLPRVTDFFAGAEQNINISSFLTPKLNYEGKEFSKFIFEIEIPRDNPAKLFRNVEIPFAPGKKEEYYLNFIRDSISVITGCSRSCVKITRGTLIDRILHKMVEDITWQGEKKELKRILLKDKDKLRRALEVIARKNLGRARKNKIDPYISHQIEIARDIDAMFKVFTPEVLNYLAAYIEDPAVTILTAIILHDAVEDGDISDNDLKGKFGEDVYGIVTLLTKDKKGEEIDYYKKLVSRGDIIALLAQLIKIADKHHNLNTLSGIWDGTKRKIFFSCIDVFIPEFIDKIDVRKMGNEEFRLVFARAIKIIKKKIIATGKELNFLDVNGRINEKEFKRYVQQKNITSGLTIYQEVIGRIQGDAGIASEEILDGGKIFGSLKELSGAGMPLEQAI